MSRAWAASRSSRSAASPPSSGSTEQVVVGVVAVVRGGREDRVQVERRDPEVGQLVEPLGQAEEVAALVAVVRRRRVPRLERRRASATRGLDAKRSGKTW